jgi:hypothetical protein
VFILNPSIIYILLLNCQVPALYKKALIDELDLVYFEKSLNIKQELEDNIKSKGTFSLTLDAWTAINQKVFLGITM